MERHARIKQTSHPRLQSRRCRPQVSTLQPTIGASGLPEFSLKKVAKLKVRFAPSSRGSYVVCPSTRTAPTSAPAPPSRPSNGSDGHSREQTMHSETPSSTSTSMRAAIRHRHASVGKESLSVNIKVDNGSTLPLEDKIEIEPDDPDEDIEPHSARSGNGLY